MSKNSAEELEKQYREYKAQFDAWKEKNKNSEGTPAYNAYVDQFCNWEKDVEKRRKGLKEKAEREAREAAAEQERKRQAEEAEQMEKMARAREDVEKRQKEAEEAARRAALDADAAAAQAAAYAQSQQQYIAHHQAEMEAEQRRQQQLQIQQQHVPVPQQFTQPPPMVVPQHAAHSGHDEINPQNLMQQMVELVMGTSAPQADKPAVYQQAPPQQTASAPPPQLWGNSKPTFDSKDPLWARWGVRAAPAHQPPPAGPPLIPAPCWMVMEALKEKKLTLAPTGPPPNIPLVGPPTGFPVPQMMGPPPPMPSFMSH